MLVTGARVFQKKNTKQPAANDVMWHGMIRRKAEYNIPN